MTSELVFEVRMRTLLCALIAGIASHGSMAAPSASRIAGRPHGIVEHRHSNGRIASREQFWLGRKIGLAETWWPNGHPRSMAAYADDVYEGEYRTFYQDGHPYELRHFERGREAGVQQSWNEDGSLYLNYEVRNGRRYGLINATPCLPADKNGYSRSITP
jgi:hypothetical protein